MVINKKHIKIDTRFLKEICDTYDDYVAIITDNETKDLMSSIREYIK